MEDLAQHHGHNAIHEWLILSRHWSPLHHLEFLSPERTRVVLRGGADLHLRPGAGDTASPLERAQQLAPGNTAASIVVCAAGPWSVKSHQLFPHAERERMATLARFLRLDEGRAMALAQALLGALRTYLFSDTTNRIDISLGATIIHHLLRLPSCGAGEPHSSSATGVIEPPSAAIWSRKWWVTRGSVEVRGSISLTESMVMARRFALCLEPIIEYVRCSASALLSAGRSIENFWRMLPKGAIPVTR